MATSMSANSPHFRTLAATNDDESKAVIQNILSPGKKFSVRHTSDVAQAVELLEQEPWDLIIVDEYTSIYAHPLISRWSELSSKTPLLLLTDDISFAKLAHLKTRYVRDILLKPIKENMLFAKVESMLHMGAHYSLETVEKLRRIEFFQNFSLDEMYRILEAGYINRFQEGQVLIRENGVIDKLGVVLKGSVTIYLKEEGGEPRIIQTLKVGHLLGETNLLSRKAAKARVVSNEDTLVFMVPYFAFHLLSDELQNKLFRFIIRHLSKKLNQTSRLLYAEKEQNEILSLQGKSGRGS